MTKTSNRRVLVADDDPRNRKLIEALLRGEGYEVRTVASGAAALAAAAAEPPDVILLDIMMPSMDGFEVLRRLKADPATDGIPVVMVTALDDDGSRARLNSAGVTDVLVKPVDRWRLKSCLERVLS